MSLLVVGIAGGMLTAAVLYVSVVENWNTPSNVQIFNENLILDVGGGEKIVLDQEDRVSFPNLIQGTTLVAERIAVYEGPFLEDGTDREVADVAALMVKNIGDKQIAKCGITLSFADENYNFYGEWIPPGATILLIEGSGAPYRLDLVRSCIGWQIISDGKNDISDLVTLEEKEMGTLIIKNRSNRVLKGIRIYYKNWLSPPEILVGGISYSVLLPSLQAGQSEILYPNHFACGYSKIVSITED